jgi:lipoprotein-releasing system permease protein
LKLIIDIARSLLLSRFRQTLVAAIGVTFGITMFITLLSFMTGLNDMLDGLIMNRTAHVRIYNDIQPSERQPIERAFGDRVIHAFVHSVKSGSARPSVYNSLSILQALRLDPRVLGVSPKLSAQVFFNDGSLEITGVMNGIDASEEVRLYKFQDYVTTGNALDIDRVEDGIILGKPLAEKLMADMGDMVTVTTSRGEQFKLKVVGYYQSGLADFDKTQSFASTPTVQKILGKSSDYFTDLQVKLHDITTAPALAAEYRITFDTAAEDIQTANAQFETGTTVRTIISYAVGIVLLIVAGFGIYNILNMMIYENMDTIAILKATGFSGTDVKRIFLSISITIGLVGCAAGLLFGYLLSALVDTIPFNTAALPTVKTYPVSYKLAFYLIAIVFSLVTTWLAGWFPARKASKIDPVIIIRGK